VGFFFFSSRRRHTRFDCDWSSDVCSSDLVLAEAEKLFGPTPVLYWERRALARALGWTEVERLAEAALAGLSARTAWEHYALGRRSEEHTSELQSQSNLVCRLLLEKKKEKI